MNNITIILLNLRFGDFYSPTLFKLIKEMYPVRLVAILDQQFKDRIGTHILSYLDKIYSLQAQTKAGFLAEFCFAQLCEIIEYEKTKNNKIKIVCADEFNLVHAGHLRRKYHIPGHTDYDLLIFRDKTKMKKILQDAGLRVPRFRLLQETDNFASISASVGLPFVIKPVDSCGSFGVNVIKYPADYLSIANTLKNTSVKFEVEEFIEGKLYHVDSCIYNNELTFICANEYTCPNHDYNKGQTLGSIPLDMMNSKAQSLITFARKALAALGANNVINHMEIFMTATQELVFLEVSARPPGALVNFTHQINFGINLMDIDFFMQSGLHVELPVRIKNEKAFWALFPLMPGKIRQFHIPNVRSRMDIQYFRELGSVILSEECQGIVGKVAQAIFYHHDPAILREDFEYMRTFCLTEM